MSSPLFLLQIVEASGNRVIASVPGGGTLEVDLIDACARAIVARGVGVFRTTAHVEKDIRDGIAEAIMGLKEQTRFIV